MRIVVTGGAGQLAHAIQRFWTGDEVILPLESELDLSRPDAVGTIIKELRPEVVINTAAFTQVDLCETETELATRVNGTSVGWLARACSQVNALLVQISTDYVFDGRGSRPYREDDPVNPLSVYGKSKCMGEREARSANSHLIVRTSWLYDAWGNNFYNTMLKLATTGMPIKVVDDQRGSPTSCRALTRQLQAAVESGWRDTVHVTCPGETTWHGFAAEIFRQHGLQVDLSPCTTAEFPRPAPRPSYSVLCGEHRRRLGGDIMPDWAEALREVVRESCNQSIEANHG